MSTTKRFALALPVLLSGLLALGACADTTAPVEPTPSFEVGGTAPNCLAGYHSETQGSGGIACVPNH